MKKTRVCVKIEKNRRREKTDDDDDDRYDESVRCDEPVSYKTGESGD
jgi:hypothetical protein